MDGEEQRDAAAVRFEHRVAQVKEAAVKGPVGMQGVLPLPGTQLLPIATCDLQVRAKAAALESNAGSVRSSLRLERVKI